MLGMATMQATHQQTQGPPQSQGSTISNLRTFLILLCSYGIVLVAQNMSSCTLHIAETTKRSNDGVQQQDNTTAAPPPLQPELCSVDQIQHGRWVPKQLPHAPYMPKNILDSSRTICYSNVSSVFRDTRPWNTYEWEVSDKQNCSFTRWNKQQFCDLMYNKTLTVVGDSLSFEHFASLSGHLGIDVNHLRRTIFGPPYLHYVSGDVCGNDTSTTLVWQTTQRYHEHEPNASLNNPIPDVVLWNVGAWYVPDAEFVVKRKSNFAKFQQWQQGHPDRLLIYRTTVPGAPGCDKFQELPTNITMQDMEALAAQDIQHNWGKFKRQNLLTLQLLNETTPALRYDVIGAYEVNILRPDGKPGNGDCVHNCEMNGKMEFYNENLLHILAKWFGSSS